MRKSDPMAAAGLMVLALLVFLVVVAGVTLGWLIGYADRADWMPTTGQLLFIALAVLACWRGIARWAKSPLDNQN